MRSKEKHVFGGCVNVICLKKKKKKNDLMYEFNLEMKSRLTNLPDERTHGVLLSIELTNEI